jgi:transcriptional regulator with XRE-family HTH domain
MLHSAILYVRPLVCQVAPRQEPVLFGEKLRKLRLKSSLSQVELARHLGLSSHSHLSNIEIGRRTASLEVILRVAYWFGVSTDYLLQNSIDVDQVELYASPENSPAAPLQLFGPKLRGLRSRRSLLQSELAEQLGQLSQSHISLLESGQKEPSVGVVLQIADYFGITTDYLLRDEIPVEESTSENEPK